MDQKRPTDNQEPLPAVPDDLLPSEVWIRDQPLLKILDTQDLTNLAILFILYIFANATIASAGMAGGIYWIVGFVTFFIPSGVATAKLYAMFPSEGAFYTWVHRAFGNTWDVFLGFFCLWYAAMLLLCTTGIAVLLLIQSIGSSFGQTWLSEPWQDLLVLFGSLCLIWLLGVLPLRVQLRLAKYTVYSYLGYILLTSLLAVWWLATGHAPQNSMDVTHLSFGPGNYSTFDVVVLSCLGIQLPLHMAGEVKAPRPKTGYVRRSILIIIAGYLIAWFTVVILISTNPASALSVENFGAWGLLFYEVFANPFGHVLSVLALLYLCWLNLLTNGIYGAAQGRVLVMLSTDWRLPRQLARWWKGTPVVAITYQMVFVFLLMCLLFVLLPSVVTASNIMDILSNLTLATSLVLWGISSCALFLVAIILVIVHSPGAEVGGPGKVTTVLWSVVGLVFMLIALALIFLFPWATELSHGQWLLGLGLMVMAPLALGGVYAWLTPESNEIWRLANSLANKTVQPQPVSVGQQQEDEP